MTEVSGKAVCTCPQCAYEFEQEVTIDVDPDTFRDECIWRSYVNDD